MPDPEHVNRSRAVGGCESAKRKEKKYRPSRLPRSFKARLITRRALRFFWGSGGKKFLRPPSEHIVEDVAVRGRKREQAGGQRRAVQRSRRRRGKRQESGRPEERGAHTTTTLFLLPSGEACLKALPGETLARHTRAVARVYTVVMRTGGRGWGDCKGTSNLRAIFYRCF